MFVFFGIGVACVEGRRERARAGELEGERDVGAVAQLAPELFEQRLLRIAGLDVDDVPGRLLHAGAVPPSPVVDVSMAVAESLPPPPVSPPVVLSSRRPSR